MSRMLQQWVNEEVGLSRQVHDFGKDFANGYLLGELLYRFNQQPDFPKFKDTDRVLHKMDNFCMLERTISSLGIKGFDSQTALRIIDKDVKATLDIVYKIKMSLNEIHVKIGRHQDEGSIPGNVFGLSRFPARMSRPQYDQAKSAIFAQSMRLRMKGQNAVDMEEHLRPFDEEKQRQDDFVEFMKQQDRENLEMYYNEIRQRAIMNKRAELEYLNDWHEKGIGIWMENQKRRRYVLDVHHRFLKQQVQQKQQREQNLIENLRNDVKEGTESHEKRITEMERKLNMIRGIEDGKHEEEHEGKSNNQLEDRSVDDTEFKISEEEEIMFLQSKPEEAMLVAPPPKMIYQIAATRKDIPDYNPGNVNKFIRDLKVRKGTEAETHKRREIRRIKFLAGLRDETCRQLNDERVKTLQDFLKQPCSVEANIRAEIEDQRKYEQVIVENRAFRDQQIQEQIEVEKITQQRRQQLAEERQRREQGQEFEWYQSNLERICLSIESARFKGVQEYCEEIVQGIVDVSLEQIDHIVSSRRPCALEEPLAASVSKFTTQSDDLHAIELDDYLNNERLWRFENGDIYGPKVVGNFLAPIRAVAQPPPEEKSQTIATSKGIDRFKLQLAINGHPLTGKSNTAWRLAARYNLQILDPLVCVQAYLHKKGRQDEVTLMDDALYVDAIVDALAELTRAQRERSQREDMRLEDNEADEELVKAGDREGLMKRLFQQWDTDGSGDIDPQEMLRATLTAHCEGKSQADVELEAFTAFTQLDFDLNGRISWEEFTQYFETVFRDEACSVLANMLKKTDIFRKPVSGWILDGFPMNRNQGRLLDLALSGKDADETEYQVPPAITLPCDEPTLIDLTPFKELGAGAIDVMIHLHADSADSVFERASKRVSVPASDRARIAPHFYNWEQTKEHIMDWYLRFGVVFDIPSAELDQIYTACADRVHSVLSEKLAREEQARQELEAKQYLMDCENVCAVWNEAIQLNSAVEEMDQEEQNEEQQDKIVAVQAILPIPLAIKDNFVRAGIVNPDVPEEELNDPVDGAWVGANFSEGTTPTNALEKIKAFHDLDSTKINAMAKSWETLLHTREIEYVLSEQEAALYESLNITKPEEAKQQVNEEEEGEKVEQETSPLELRAAMLEKLFQVLSMPKENTEEEEGKEEEKTAIEEKLPIDFTAKVLAAVRDLATIEVEKKRKELEELEKKNKKKGGTAAKETKQEEEELSEQEKEAELQRQEAAKRMLHQEFATKVVSVIDKFDQEFVDRAKSVFGKLHNLREEWSTHFLEERARVDQFLLDPASDIPKMELVTDFQNSFDEIAEEMRYHSVTKAELHHKAEDLANGIWDNVQERKVKAQEMLTAIREADWVPTFREMTMDNYLELMQLEVARFQGIRGSMIQLGNKLANGDEDFVSEEQAKLYNVVFPVAAIFGESLDPEVQFVDASAEPGGKQPKKGKKDQIEETEAQPPPECDPRIATAIQVARRLYEQMQSLDLENLPEELRKAFKSLDDKFLQNLTRLEEKANRKFKSFTEIAETYWKDHSLRIEERFDAELLALEALVQHAARCIEDSTNLIYKLKLEGASFLLAEQLERRSLSN